MKNKKKVSFQLRQDPRRVAEKIAKMIVSRQKSQQLKWNKDGSVRVVIGRIMPTGSAIRKTLAERRKRFRAALRERLAVEGWEEARLHSYQRLATQHKQVRVKVGEFEADVDEELAPLIKQLVMAGIGTELSCQENRPGIAWIMFSSVNDLCEFLNIVAEYDPDEGSLYRRATLAGDEGCWEYGLIPEDVALHETVTEDGIVDESHDGQECFHFFPSVRFPRTDLPELLDKMMRHNFFLKTSGALFRRFAMQGDALIDHTVNRCRSRRIVGTANVEIDPRSESVSRTGQE